MTEQADSETPEIRFAGFTGAWNELPLGGLLAFKNGYNAGKSQYGAGEKFINVLDIIENNFITHDRIKGRVGISVKDFDKYRVIFGDILFQRSSETREEVGQANVYLDKGKAAVFGGFVIRGRPLSEFDSVFFNFMLKTAKARKEITSRSGGSTRYNIGQESLEDALVRIAPDLAEQTKIGTYFEELDRMIMLHQRKHEKLVTLKQAMLQRMFPRDGAAIPEVRFKSFSEPWVAKKLGALCDSFQYGINAPAKKYDGHNKYIRITDIDESSRAFSHADLTTPDADLSKSQSYLLGDGDIVFARTGASVGKTYRYKGEDGRVFFAGFLIRARVSNVECVDFIFYATLTRHFRKFVAITSQRSGQPGINALEYSSYTFSVPSDPAEQQKIGAYFRNLDHLISKHATQIAKLKNIKSACLEKMFV